MQVCVDIWRAGYHKSFSLFSSTISWGGVLCGWGGGVGGGGGAVRVRAIGEHDQTWDRS